MIGGTSPIAAERRFSGHRNAQKWRFAKQEDSPPRWNEVARLVQQILQPSTRCSWNLSSQGMPHSTANNTEIAAALKDLQHIPGIGPSLA